MRTGVLSLMVLLATPALAQPTPPSATPPTRAMTRPTTVAKPPAPAPAKRPLTKAEQEEQRQKAMAEKKALDKMTREIIGQSYVTGRMLSCLVKEVGQKPTMQFYDELKAVGKAIEGLCKNNKPAEARTLLQSTIEKNADRSITKKALGCYDVQLPNILQLTSQSFIANSANYTRWLRNPEAAKTEINDAKLCEGIPVAPTPVAASPAASPAAPATAKPAPTKTDLPEESL